METTAERKSIECNICHKKFNGQQGLATHRRWAHERGGRSKMLAASRLGAKKRAKNIPSIDEELLARGQRIDGLTNGEEEATAFKCQHCDHEPFHSESGLRYHLKTQHGKQASGINRSGKKLRGAICPECGYKSSAHGVAVHRRFKHGVIGAFNRKNQKHDCSYCESFFSSQEDLDLHMRISHPGKTGLVELRGRGQRFDTGTELPAAQHIKFCPNCGEDLQNWRKE